MHSLFYHLVNTLGSLLYQVKRNFKSKGAIFEDAPGDRSGFLTHM